MQKRQPLKAEKAFCMASIFQKYPKLGGQSRITYAVATIFIFARFVKYIPGVTNFFVEKALQQ